MLRLKIIILFFTLSGLNAQETFHVLHIEGTILYDTITKPLEMGDEIVGNPKFKFSSVQDRAVLLSNLRGRLILFSFQKTKEKKSEFEYYFKNNILPVKEYTATRGDTADIIHLFFKDSLLYLPKRIVAFKIPENHASYYILEYFICERRYQTKLKIIENSQIELNSSAFLSGSDYLDFNQLNNVSLKYYTEKNDKVIDINSIRFRSYQLEDIRKELLFLKDRLKEQKLSERLVIMELADFLRQSYGSDLKLEDFEIQ